MLGTIFVLILEHEIVVDNYFPRLIPAKNPVAVCFHRPHKEAVLVSPDRRQELHPAVIVLAELHRHFPAEFGEPKLVHLYDVELSVGVAHNEDVVMEGHGDDGVVVMSLKVDHGGEFVRVEVEDARRGRVCIAFTPEGQIIILDADAEYLSGGGIAPEELVFLVTREMSPEGSHEVI